MSKKDIKLVAVGDGATGKTSLLTVLKGEPFPERYIPTIFENYSQNYKQDDVNYELHIWDTPGQDEYDRLRPISYQDAKVILLCFALDKRQSFLNLSERWIMEVKYYCKDARIILAGMKSDLRESGNPNHISDEEARQFCIDQKFSEYVPCSAKTKDNVNRIFPSVVQACKEKKHGVCQLL